MRERAWLEGGCPRGRVRLVAGTGSPRSQPGQVDVNVRCLDGDRCERFEVEPFDGQSWQDDVGTVR